MAGHDLQIVPSREDQFPNRVLEALGLPVVGSRVDGIAHILNDARLLFDPGDPDDLLRVLSRAFTQEGYAEMGRLVRKRAAAFRFCWEGRYLRLLIGSSADATK